MNSAVYLVLILCLLCAVQAKPGRQRGHGRHGNANKHSGDSSHSHSHSSSSSSSSSTQKPPTIGCECFSNLDCEIDECCAWIDSIKMAVCGKYGQRFSDCQEYSHENDMYSGGCPCFPDLTCHKGECKFPCNHTDQCDYEECCLNQTPIRGKRDVSTSNGICEQNGNENDLCYVNNGQSGTGLWNGRCPCYTDYYCKGEGLIEIPYGERGSCKPVPVP